MFCFYSPEMEIPESEEKARLHPVYLNKDESHHAVQVLRLQKNEPIQIINGKGIVFEAYILKPDAKACQVQIRSYSLKEKKPYQFHLVIAPTKNLDRMEWLVEKATEIGMDTLSPVLCQNSERRIFHMERIQKVIISALKQSGQGYMPQLNSLKSFSDFLKSAPYPNPMVAHCRNSERIPFPQAVQRGNGNEFTIFIGPEGDFTEKEIEDLKKNDFLPISLGNNRLRTETAGLLVCAQLALLKA
jgi:16S rRNA (uracil1498-N3)-methyltransferase